MAATDVKEARGFEPKLYTFVIAEWSIPIPPVLKDDTLKQGNKQTLVTSTNEITVDAIVCKFLILPSGIIRHS